MRCRKIENGINYLRIKSFLQNDKNSNVLNYYQIGPSNMELFSKMSIFAQIIEEPLFDSLRTQQQLGYSVSINPAINHNVVGMEIEVKCQENIHTSKYVEGKIEEFVQIKMKEVLNDLTDEEFNLNRQSMVKSLLQPPRTLDHAFSQNWTYISVRDYSFDRLEKIANYMTTLTKKDLIEFYETYFEKSKQRKLSVQVVGSSEDVAENNNTVVDLKNLKVLSDMETSGDINVIKDVEEFKNSLQLHPYIEKPM